MTKMNDDFDVYGNLEEFDYEIKYKEALVNMEELKKQINSLNTQIEITDKEMLSVKKINKTLEKNCTSLLLTAKTEIARKDRFINEFQSTDNINSKGHNSNGKSLKRSFNILTQTNSVKQVNCGTQFTPTNKCVATQFTPITKCTATQTIKLQKDTSSEIIPICEKINILQNNLPREKIVFHEQNLSNVKSIFEEKLNETEILAEHQKVKTEAENKTSKDQKINEDKKLINEKRKSSDNSNDSKKSDSIYLNEKKSDDMINLKQFTDSFNCEKTIPNTKSKKSTIIEPKKNIPKQRKIPKRTETANVQAATPTPNEIPAIIVDQSNTKENFEIKLEEKIILNKNKNDSSFDTDEEYDNLLLNYVVKNVSTAINNNKKSNNLSLPTIFDDNQKDNELRNFKGLSENENLPTIIETTTPIVSADSIIKNIDENSTEEVSQNKRKLDNSEILNGNEIKKVKSNSDETISPRKSIKLNTQNSIYEIETIGNETNVFIKRRGGNKKKRTTKN